MIIQNKVHFSIEKYYIQICQRVLKRLKQYTNWKVYDKFLQWNKFLILHKYIYLYIKNSSSFGESFDLDEYSINVRFISIWKKNKVFEFSDYLIIY